MKVTVYLKKCSPDTSNICFRVREKNVDIKVVSPLEVQDKYWDTDSLRRSEKLLKISKVSYAWKTYRKHFSRSLDFVEIIPRPRLVPL